MILDDLVSGFLEDPVLVAIVVIMLTFLFFTYLFLRRTATQFKEGLSGGRE